MTTEIALDTRELTRLETDLREHARQTGPVINKAIAAATEYVYAVAESTVKVATGDMREHLKRDTSGITGTQARRVYDDDPGAMALEYGTSRQAPQPFLMIHSTTAERVLEQAVLEQMGRLKI